MFVGVFSWLLGAIYNQFFCTKEQRISIPWYHGAKCGGAVVTITVCYSYAIKFTNFPVVMMIRSCSLLSVVIVGVLFTGVSDVKQKLGSRKIFVAMVVTLGMIIFKVYDPNVHEDSHNTELIGVLLMVLSLISEGFLPDFQAVIKQKYKPQPTILLTFVNKWTTILTIAYSILMGHFL
jgi:drug/metabolite transporter (DMT)-like permease